MQKIIELQLIEMQKIIDELSRVHDRAKVFRDFLKMTMDFMQGKLSPRRGYNDQEIVLFQKFYHGLLDLYTMQEKDHLGELYMTLAIESSKSKGQYFTPSNLGEITRNIMSDDEIFAAIKNKGYVSIYEPTCGSGALIIDFASRLKSMGINPATSLLVYAQDLDQKSVFMTFISSTLLGIPLVIDWGDTLERERRARYKNLFYRLRFEKCNLLKLRD